MSSIKLTPTSYVVLGLIARDGPSTPYELEVAAEDFVYWWPFPHSQLYSEPARLARSGFLVEEREKAGRRRRVYRVTELGLEALKAWLRQGVTSMPQLRDMALLQLYFGRHGTREDMPNLGRQQATEHRARLGLFKAIVAELELAGDRSFQAEVARLGVEMTETFIKFWEQLGERYASNTEGANRKRGIPRPSRAPGSLGASKNTKQL